MQDTSSCLLVFLFTDLVDSTALKERLGDRDYVRTIAQPHNALFRELLARYPTGRERDNAGDGFFATFKSVGDAVLFALQFQHALRVTPWEIVAPQTRIGIHLGEALEFVDPGSDAIKSAGQAQDLAARVMGLALGGQILLTRSASDSARQYVREHPAGAEFLLTWLAHGKYLFKGREEPLEIFEVGAAGQAPLAAPRDSEKARRVVTAEEEATLGWRPAAGLRIPRRSGWFVQQKLGEGGFGEVWLARHERTKELRVFKFCFDVERLRSFKRELTFFRLLRKHLGERDDIARILEVQVEQPPFYLESEYLPLGNLGQWAEGRGGIRTLPLTERVALLARIARTVAATHALGIIHKDLKPSNILMDEADGEPRHRISDFGIGALVDRGLLAEITETGFTQSLLGNDSSRTGTRMYSPPESQLGKPATTAGDIYALGVMLSQFVVGDLHRPLGPGWEEDVPDELLRQDILLATHRDPERRLASAADLAERLETLDERHATRAEAHRKDQERSAAEERARAQVRRVSILRRVLAASASAAIVCGVLAAVSYWQWRRAEQAATDLAAANSSLTVSEGNLTKANSELERETRQARAAEHSLRSMVGTSEWKAGNLYRLSRLLDDQKPQKKGEPDRRGWEWWHLERQIHAALRRHSTDPAPLEGVFGQHPTAVAVTSLAIHPEGKLGAAAQQRGAILIFTVADGKTIQELRPANVTGQIGGARRRLQS